MRCPASFSASIASLTIGLLLLGGLAAEALAQGLAAKYPGDKGIGNDPDVLYFLDFDDKNATLAWAGGTTGYGWTGKSENVYSGAGALEIQQIAGTHHPYEISPKIQEVELVHVRWYRKWDKGYDFTQHKMPGVYAKAGPTSAGVKPNGYDKYSCKLYVDFNRHPRMYSYHPEQEGIYGDELPMNLVSPEIQVEDERWYCFEMMLKANTPKQHDGELKMWIDGKLVGHRKNMRFRDTATLKVNLFTYSAYIGGTWTSKKNQKLWDDQIVVARKYIGPVQPTGPKTDGPATDGPAPDSHPSVDASSDQPADAGGVPADVEPSEQHEARPPGVEPSGRELGPAAASADDPADVKSARLAGGCTLGPDDIETRAWLALLLPGLALILVRARRRLAGRTRPQPPSVPPPPRRRRTMPSLAGPRLLLPLALLGIGCSTATSPTALDPDDLLSRYAQDGVADDAFCLLVEVVCGDPRFTQSEQCATLDQICSPSIPAADGGSPTGVPPADDAAPGAVAPGPQAPETGFTASASSSQPGAGAEKAFDGDTATTWENLSATAPGTGNCWLRADFGVGVQKALVRYDLYVRDNAPTFGGPAHFPKSWVFQGGDCATWNDLDTRAGQTLAADAWASFTFSSSSAHRCYRILVTASQGDTQWVNINEMRLYSTGTSSDAGGSPDPCSGVTCSGHGSCKVSGGAAQCVCDPGYHESGLTCAPDPAPTTCVGVIGLCSGGSTSGFGSGNVYTVSGGSICSAAKQLKPGDTLYVRQGTYTETLTDSCFTANGTASDRIYISGYPGETAVMDGKNDNGRRNAMSFKTRKFITIRNLEIRDYTGVSIWNDPGCESMVYENLYIHDIGKQTTYQWPCGLEFKGGKNSILRQSRLDNIGTDSLDHGIYLSYQSTGARINNNHFSKMSGAAVHAWHDVAAIGTLVYNNIITGSQHEAAIVFGDGSHDIKIYNNTLVENAGGGIRIFDYGETSKSPAHDVVIRNNILYKGGLQVMSGCKNVTQSNNTTANPLFVNAAAGDYRLQPASPAVDAGAAVPEVKTDIAGVTRPQGSAHDIGAHER